MRAVGLFIILLNIYYAFGDDIVISKSYRGKTIPTGPLGILSISKIDSINICTLADKTYYDRLAAVKENIEKQLLIRLPEFSSFSQISFISGINEKDLVKTGFKIGRRDSIYLEIPKEQALKALGAPRYILCLEIEYVYADTGSVNVDVKGLVISSMNMGATSGPAGIELPGGSVPYEGKIVANNPSNLCLNFSCRFAFINTNNYSIICYGKVTAEGCGYPYDRGASDDIWSFSIYDLSGEIVEGTPFEKKQSKSLKKLNLFGP